MRVSEGTRGASLQLRGSGYASYRQGAWSVYSTYGYIRFENDVAARMRRTDRATARPLLRQSTGIGFTMDGHNLTADVEYAPDSMTTWSLELTAGWQYHAFQRSVAGRSHEAGTARSYRRVVDIATPQRNLSGRLALDHAFDTDHTLSAAVRCARGDRETSAREQEVDRDRRRRRQRKTDRDEEAVLHLDYEWPAGPLTLELGYQGTLRRLSQRYRLMPSAPETERFADRPS